MAIEEKVIQPESVTNAEQPVAETTSQPQAPNLDSVKAEYEAKLAALQKQVADEQEKFKGAKSKLDEVYKKKEAERTKELEDQGVLLPVRSYSIKYIAPAKYDDILKIQTTITKLDGARIEFSYVIHTSEDVLIAKAETELVFVSANSLRPIPMPKKFKELVLKLEVE